MDGTYRVVLDPDPEDGGYTVTVPAMPGVVTQGDTVGWCLERAREAIALHLAAMAKDDEQIEVELDKGHDEPIFGPLTRTEMGARFRLAREIAGKLGGRGAAGTKRTVGQPAADNRDETEAPRS